MEDLKKGKFGRSPAVWEVVLAFALGTVGGGLSANIGYNWLVNSNPQDDSLEILVFLLAILIGISIVSITLTASFRVWTGKSTSTDAVGKAIMVGAVYGTLPAIGFICEDHLPSLTLVEPVILSTALAGPMCFGVWICSRRPDPDARPCVDCGYDLRATAGPCPECGAIAPEAVDGQ